MFFRRVVTIFGFIVFLIHGRNSIIPTTLNFHIQEKKIFIQNYCELITIDLINQFLFLKVSLIKDLTTFIRFENLRLFTKSFFTLECKRNFVRWRSSQDFFRLI